MSFENCELNSVTEGKSSICTRVFSIMIKEPRSHSAQCQKLKLITESNDPSPHSCEIHPLIPILPPYLHRPLPGLLVPSSSLVSWHGLQRQETN